jgi:hypothetical protein
MQIENKALVLDLMEWVSCQPRTYAQVMEVWRTSCPRLPVWEDALEHGLVACSRNERLGTTLVTLTAGGRAFLNAERPAALRA